MRLIISGDGEKRPWGDGQYVRLMPTKLEQRLFILGGRMPTSILYGVFCSIRLSSRRLAETHAYFSCLISVYWTVINHLSTVERVSVMHTLSLATSCLRFQGPRV